ncbi:aldose epimerase family protein [Cellulophaga sp. L1A9]|uniref:aldose epimerase family protein n=1 Tax=Cellulophaga sp. L1A9 TaxID=2686362 RepID=UPI00131BA212|nr:aldose epimerase family protein [Cellulophaga sp. L1A9]
MIQNTIKNDKIELTVLDFGAIIQKIIVKDKNGLPTNMVVGFDGPEDYLINPMFLGACIGRYAGRISQGSFSLDGKTFAIHKEEGVHLHGGTRGFDKKYFKVDEINHGAKPFIQLSYLSEHLEEGYPGNLKVTVTYTLDDDALIITHKATTDKKTVVNLTNHSYFKLDNAAEINHYDLQLDCSKILDTDKNLLPSGKLTEVAYTNYDFLEKKKINTTRLDTPFVISKSKDICASVHSGISGITLEVTTNQPAVVIYTPETTGSICFETQNYPDAPNHPNFPSSVLSNGEKYFNQSTFRFKA